MLFRYANIFQSVPPAGPDAIHCITEFDDRNKQTGGLGADNECWMILVLCSLGTKFSMFQMLALNVQKRVDAATITT